MTASPSVMRHPNLAGLARELAQSVARDLSAAIDARGQASLIVSGGRSPVALFECLRSISIDWQRVFVRLADERWVAPDDPASNEKLVRDVLLAGAAAAARFTGLKNDAADPASGANAAWKGFAGVPRPFDVVLLGMGDDGHTASLFPQSPELARGLDPAAPPGLIGMRAPSAPHDRLSLNLAAILDSRRIVILITGESKWHTYIAASRPEAAEQMPVRAVLQQERTPVDVVWAP